MSNQKSIEEILKEEQQLERKLELLRAERAALERNTRLPKKAVPPLRDQVLDLLQEANIPLNSLLLASVMKPLLGRSVPSTRFGTLSNDEVKSFDSSRARPAYLCHCITYDQGQPVKRFWARSDWELADRIMAPMTGRVLFLRGAAWAIKLARAVSLDERHVANAEILNFVAADQARDAGLQVKRGEFPYDTWLQAIDDAVAKIADDDRRVREDAARQLQESLSDREQLFGSAKGFVSLPGSRSSWRSGNE